jgi:hypothetical protein
LVEVQDFPPLPTRAPCDAEVCPPVATAEPARLPLPTETDAGELDLAVETSCENSADSLGCERRMTV